MGYPIPNAAPIDLKLCLARPPAANATRKTRHRRTLAREPGEEVFELGQLHLNSSLPALGPLGEDV